MAEINKIKVGDTNYDIRDVNSRVYTTLVPYGTTIPANADLNTTTYLKVGNYYCSADVTVATLSNRPTDRAFMMQVYSPLAITIDNETTNTWVYRIRKLLTYTGLEYIQKVSSGGTKGVFTYGNWEKVMVSSDLGDQATYSFDSSTGTLSITTKD